VEACDVLVVGGGPAGSTCAWQLRRAGLDVAVLDRARFPRDKVCAGWITPQTAEALELDRAEYASRRVLQPIHGFRVSLEGGAEARVDYGRPVSFGIRRCEFDHYLLERSGARLRLGEPVASIRREAGRWIVNEAIAARLLVGAGGHLCPVARELGGGDEPLAVVAAQEIEFALDEGARADCPVEAELPELFFARDLRGYAWAVRKGAWLNVGLGRQHARDVRAQALRFVDFLRASGRLRDALPGPLRGHAYRLWGRPHRPLVAEQALLVGDAAGLAYPRSGEGIRPAVESGLLAARAIAQAGGRYARESLLPYARAIEQRFGRPPAHGARGPSDWVPARFRDRLAERLLASDWFARRVVVDRWFLHAREPALA
jgi:geranylgeranyl reductase family protein